VRVRDGPGRLLVEVHGTEVTVGMRQMHVMRDQESTSALRTAIRLARDVGWRLQTMRNVLQDAGNRELTASGALAVVPV
jgi:hypothetical protein